jgi:uncharacterized protein (TIGR02271 family)
VEVRKEVHTKPKYLTVPVEREEVVIERRPVSGRASGGDIKAEEIRIPVKEEKVQAEKEPVVKQEVNAAERKVQDAKTGSGEARSDSAGKLIPNPRHQIPKKRLVGIWCLGFGISLPAGSRQCEQFLTPDPLAELHVGQVAARPGAGVGHPPHVPCGVGVARPLQHDGHFFPLG